MQQTRRDVPMLYIMYTLCDSQIYRLSPFREPSREEINSYSIHITNILGDTICIRRYAVE